MFQPLEKQWSVMMKKADFKRNAEKFHINIVLARLIRNRELVEDQEIQKYLYGTSESLYSPFELKNMDLAVEILSAKIAQQKKLRIFGDYDIDGVMASYILYKGLKRLGLECSIRIPHRIQDGFGLNRKMVEEAIEEGIDTILTCDNGIAAKAEIEFAREHGLTVVLTDHHEVPYETQGGEKKYILPPADVIVNPVQPGCPYPNKQLCGAAVAWKLITALFERHGIPKEELNDYYELVAIATVGDVMDLRDENRILVKEGLKRLPYTKNIGLRALIKANNLEGKQLTAYSIGFVIGPCINAGGRLETALLALELFQCQDPLLAREKAEELVKINTIRKDLTEGGVFEAVEWVENSYPVIEGDGSKYGQIDRVLVVYLPNCHESIAGIIAGRLRERYSRPTIVLTNAEHGIKGSGRSIEEYSMYEELVKCEDLLTKFGGHPMAAGLSLEKENIDTLRKRLNANCNLTEKDLSPKVKVDAPLPFAMLNEEVIQQLDLLEPFGKGNTKPSFALKNVEIKSVNVVGKNKNVVKLRLADEYGCVMEGVYFQNAKQFMEDLGNKRTMDAIIYYPKINEFNGMRNIEVIIQDYRI